MTNPFEELEQRLMNIAVRIESLEAKINPNKRWLSTQELAEYIPYSKETINKKVQSGEFIHGVHFHQQAKLRIFDRVKIDEWIISNKLTTSQELLKESLLQKIQSDL